MIRILRAAEHKSMPWKNGGGVTTEIAVHPQGAGLGDFHWRVSMARVESDGPFSRFPGVDRTLAVLAGEGILLKVHGMIPLGLRNTSDPVTFPADVPTSCHLIGGSIIDLNVMVRRGVAQSSVQPVGIDRALDLTPAADWTLVLIDRGRVFLHHERSVDSLGEKDCVLAGGGGSTLTFKPYRDARLFLIELSSVS